MPAALPISIPGFTDPVSSFSHLAGAAAFAGLTVPLIRKGLRAQDPGRPARVISLAVFSLSAVSLLSLSGVYHMLARDGTARDVLQRLDHAAIFILIAGTFTPIHTILFKGPWRWGMLAFIWTYAATGVTLKTIFFNSVPEGLGVVLYLLMGWFGAVSMFHIARRFGLRKIKHIVLGGLVYSAGAAVEWANPPAIIDGVIRAHEVFHIAVLIGLGFHWRFVWSIADEVPVFTAVRAAITTADSIAHPAA
jgi:channel protein (hemolysin III family)